MIQWMLAIWCWVPLPFLNPVWTSGISWFTYCWSQMSEGPLCRDQHTQMLMIKVSINCKKMCVFWWWEGKEGDGQVCKKGGRWHPFSLGPRPGRPYLLRNWEWELGEWSLSTEDWRFLSTEDFFLNTLSHWWGEKDLMFWVFWRSHLGRGVM